MKKIFLGFTITLIIIATVITGNPVVRNDEIINISTALVGIIFGIYIIVKRKGIELSKQGIAVLALCTTSVIPLIFNTYSSLSGTVYYIFRYISLFVIYIIVSYLISEEPKYKVYIKNTLIISGIILVLFGIDLMSTQITKEFVAKIIGRKLGQEWETRMFSLFLYSNTFAIAVIVSYILGLGEILKGKFTAVYGGILTLLMSAILLTQSRLCILLMGLGLVVYFIFIKPENKYKFIKVLFVNAIFAAVYAVMFGSLKQAGHMVFIWVMTILLVVPSGCIIKLLLENEKINKIINWKVFAILTGVGIIGFAILTCFKTPLVLFNGENAQKETYKEIVNLKPNKEYTIRFKVEAVSNTQTDNYKILFIQRNKYSDEITRQEISLNNCHKEFLVTTTTHEDIDLIEFKVVANETNENTKLVVESLKVNDEDFVLNYRFLPTDIINKLKYMKLSQKSVWERWAFLKDGLSIIGQNSLLGLGGDCWRYKQFEAQSYYYNALQMHCYVLQVFMEMGVLGGISLCFALIIVFKTIWRLIKQKEDIDLSIGIAFCVLLAHALLDFDMTFFCIMWIFYILLTMIDSKNKKYNMKEHMKIVSGVTVCIICGVMIYFNSVQMYVEETQEKSLTEVKTYEEKTKLQNLYISLLPYYEQYKIDRAQYLELYVNVMEVTEEQKNSMNQEQVEWLKKCVKTEKDKPDTINKCAIILNLSNSDEDKEFAYKKIEEIFSKHRYNATQVYNNYMQLYYLIYGQSYGYQINQEQADAQIQVLENTNYDTNRLLKIVNDNIGKDVEYIKNYEKCRITEEEAIKRIEIIQGVNK